MSLTTLTVTCNTHCHSQHSLLSLTTHTVTHNTHCHMQHTLSLTTLTVTCNTHCHSQHSLSLTTLTVTCNTHCHSQHSPLLPFYQHPFSYIICGKSEHFHYFPNSHDRKQLKLIIFSGFNGIFS